MTQGKFIVKSIGVGMLLYIVIGFILAVIIINMGDKSAHPHSMIELLYLFLPSIGAITGLVLGFLLSSMKEKYNFRLVIKQLLISIPFSLLLLFIVVYMTISGS